MYKIWGVQLIILLSWTTDISKLLQQFRPGIWLSSIWNVGKNYHSKCKKLYSVLCNLILWRHSFLLEKSHCHTYFKQGKDSFFVTSYWPIALTSCLYKLFNKIINCWLVHFLETVYLILTNAVFQKVDPPLTTWCISRQRSETLSFISTFSSQWFSIWKRCMTPHDYLAYCDSSQI